MSDHYERYDMFGNKIPSEEAQAAIQTMIDAGFGPVMAGAVARKAAQRGSPVRVPGKLPIRKGGPTRPATRPSQLTPQPAPGQGSPTTDAGFAAYARQMTGGTRNLLPGWKRFRSFPNLRPVKEWVWYGRALYADRHRQSHPILNPTRTQSAMMASRTATLAPRAGRPPIRSPGRPMAKVRGFVGAAFGGTIIVREADAPDGTHWTLWHMSSGDMFRDDFYVIRRGPLGDPNYWGPPAAWSSTSDTPADLARANLQFSEFIRVETPPAPPLPPAPPAPPGTPAAGGGGVVVNAIPGEEGRAVGAPLTSEEIAMDAAQPGSNIDPVTGRWIAGTTGPTAEYLASHPASVTVQPGGQPEGQPQPGDPTQPYGGQPYPEAQPSPEAQPGYPGGSAQVNVPPGDPYGRRYGGPPSAPPGYPPSAPPGYPPSEDGEDETPPEDEDEVPPDEDEVEAASGAVDPITEARRLTLQTALAPKIVELGQALLAHPGTSVRAKRHFQNLLALWTYHESGGAMSSDLLARFAGDIVKWREFLGSAPESRSSATAGLGVRMF